MKMMKPLFSIIVPIYNIEEYLEKCILSLVNQTVKEIEIILVDDGSTDGCPEICDRYSREDNRIRVIHKKNGGLVSARIAGALQAKGNYIACVDGDDWISFDYLDKFRKIIDMSQADVVCCGAIWVYGDKKVEIPFPLKSGIYNKKEMEEKIYPILIEGKDGTYFPPSLWAKVFKKELYVSQQCAVDPLLKIGEDNACVKPCIYYAESVGVCDESLYYYRQNPSSMTKNGKAFDWNGPLMIARHLEKQLPTNKYDFQEQIWRNYIHNMFNVVASQFNREESYKKICIEIQKKLECSYFQTALKNVKYGNGAWKSKLSKMALTKQRFWMIFIYNKFF